MPFCSCSLRRIREGTFLPLYVRLAFLILGIQVEVVSPSLSPFSVDQDDSVLLVQTKSHGRTNPPVMYFSIRVS